jgi:hypothetical protein
MTLHDWEEDELEGPLRIYHMEVSYPRSDCTFGTLNSTSFRKAVIYSSSTFRRSYSRGLGLSISIPYSPPAGP